MSINIDVKGNSGCSVGILDDNGKLLRILDSMKMDH